MLQLPALVQMLQLTQEARLLILLNILDHKTQKKMNVLPPLGDSSSDSQQPSQGTSGTQKCLVPGEVANENRSRSVKSITILRRWSGIFQLLDLFPENGLA